MKRIIQKLRTTIVAVLLTAAAVITANGQNIALTITPGGNKTGSSLQNALAGVDLGTITKLEINGGDITTNDWNYLKNNRNSFTSMTHFTVTDNVASVADIPNTDTDKPYFKEDKIQNISIAKVKTIGEKAFRRCASLSTISLPEAQTIGNYAFYVCPKLSSVSLPKAQTIGLGAFISCHSLSGLSLPEAQTVGYGAFDDCYRLSSVSLPKAQTIKEYAFKYCDALSELKLGKTPPTVDNINAFEGCPAARKLKFINENSEALTGAALAKAIADYRAVNDGSTTDNKWYGFSLPCMEISINGEATIYKGDNLEKALSKTGVGLGRITELKIVDGDITDKDWNYLKSKRDEFTSMTHFTVTDDVTSVADIPDTDTDKPYFKKDKIENISIAKVKTIGENAFIDCSSLKTVDLPKAETIGYGAFYNCSELSTVYLPKAQTIGLGAFINCSSISTLSLPKAQTFEEGAFKRCTSLSELKLGKTPPTVNNINAFEGCPDSRYLTYVNEDGTALTGAALTKAIADYKAVTDGSTTDNKWYGWIIDPDKPAVTSPVRYEYGDESVSLSATALANHSLNWYTQATGGTALSAAPKPKTNAVGTTYFYVSQTNKSNNIEGERAKIEVIVSKAKIKGITFKDVSYVYDGQAKSLSISGTLPTGATVAYTNNSHTDAGVYTVTAQITGGSNYLDKTLTAKLTIKKAPQTITWSQGLAWGCKGKNSLTLNAVSSSGLDVEYSTDNASTVSISGNTISVSDDKDATVTASQPGNKNYLAAESVSKKLIGSVDNLVSTKWGEVIVFDNTSGNYTAWQWYKNGSLISGATQQYYNANTALNGTYYAMVTDKSGRKLQTCPLEVKPGVKQQGISVSPNPVNRGSEILIKSDYSQSELAGAKLHIVSLTGNKEQTVPMNQSSISVNAPNIAGLYIVRLVLSSGVQSSVNIIVN